MLRTVLNASKQLAGIARSVSTTALPSKIPPSAQLLMPRLVPLTGPTLRLPKIPVLNDPPSAIQSFIIKNPVRHNEVTTPSTGPSIQDPCKIIEKQAARLIIIRRKKMRRHKLKKLRKKMKFVYAKVVQKRELKKEKAFQGEILAQLKTAEKFDAQAYVADKIRKVHEVPTPKLWKGKRLPEFVILDLIKKRDEKLKRITRDVHRRQTMRALVSDYKV